MTQQKGKERGDNSEGGNRLERVKNETKKTEALPATQKKVIRQEVGERPSSKRRVKPNTRQVKWKRENTRRPGWYTAKRWYRSKGSEKRKEREGGGQTGRGTHGLKKGVQKQNLRRMTVRERGAGRNGKVPLGNRALL